MAGPSEGGIAFSSKTDNQELCLTIILLEKREELGQDPSRTAVLIYLKYVFRLGEHMSRVMGQSSLPITPQENNDLNSRLARDQVVHLETAGNLFRGQRQVNNFSQVVLFLS